MENLEVISHTIHKIPSEEYGEPNLCNVNHDSTVTFSTNKGKVVTFNKTTEKFNAVPINENIGAIRNLRFLTFEQVVFMTDEHNIYVDSEVVYTLENKILNLAWNPSDRYFVIIDDKNELNGFTLSVGASLKEIIHVHTGHLESSVPNSVYVGWGSHNTQFKGSKKTTETIEEIVQEYAPPKISWRGNGEELVINFWRDGKRYLKVFDHSLNPLYESDVFLNLFRPTSFKGQGNCIACAVVQNNQNKIVIFEKNCLVKSDFLLPSCEGITQEILYHPEMNLLGVYSLDAKDMGYLNIYLNTNAQWYLKQQLCFSPDNKLKSFGWIPTQNSLTLDLSIMTSTNIQFYEFRKNITRSPMHPLVAVINGRDINLTSFDHSIIPPPLSGSVLSLNHPVNTVLFHPVFKQVLIIDSQFNIKVFVFNDELIEKISTSCNELHKDVSSLMDSFCSSNNFENLSSSEILNELTGSVTEKPDILNHVTIDDNKCQIYSIKKTIKDDIYQFTLRVDNVLIVNDNEVCNAVNSIYIYNNYLLFTHLSSKLYCIRLLPEILNQDKWDLSQIYSHETEQGAIIVCVTEDSVILQIPRGNLETITCRLISIDLIEKLLSENNWESAVSRIRKERLNWNLLIDLNPERFRNNIEHFVKAASTVSVLNTIISEFNEKNCLQTLYTYNFNKSVENNHDVKKKAFCDILEYVNRIDPISNLVSIVSVQIRHFSLKAALRSVYYAYKLKEIEMCKKAVYQILLYSHTSNVINSAYTLYNINFVAFIYNCCSEDPKVYELQLEKLKTLDEIDLRFQMNVNGKNYVNATKYLLRSKNFDTSFTTSFITNHHTQDIAYLSCPKNNPHFKLVTKLMASKISFKRKYNEAGLVLYRAGLLRESLSEFVKAGNWSKVSSLVSELKLNEDERKSTFEELVDNLVQNKKLEEAALCYQFELNDVKSAIDVWLDNQKFQKALNLAYQIGDLDLIAVKILPNLSTYTDALKDRISELSEKIHTYTDRLEEVRNDKLSSLTNVDATSYDQFGEDDLFSESGSTASSRSLTGSSRSRASNRSSKSHKKEAKKKVDLRKGGFYEDIALIRQLYYLISDIFKIGYDVQEVCEAYMMVDKDDNFKMCRSLHMNLSNAQKQSLNCIPRVWSDTFLNSVPSSNPKVLSVIQNKEDLDEKYRTPPSKEILDENWKLYWFIEAS